ncbi:MAG: hypothetical protein M1377_05850 [Deltaproteobacteria bacterium]|nr:hypothetical protein [Deltaproteobacteria bacterium]
MRNRKTLQILLFIVLAAFLAGCATTGTAPTAPAKTASQIAKETSLHFMGVYKAQFADAASMGALAQQGKLSLGQLQIYRVKRELLIKLKPLIEAFDAIVAGGGIPSADREQEINNEINQLVATAGGA